VSSLWGEQGWLLIRPATWRKVCKPRYASRRQPGEGRSSPRFRGVRHARWRYHRLRRGAAVPLANIRAMYEAFREYGTLSGQHEIPTGMIY
jgi:hypothetical protein